MKNNIEKFLLMTMVLLIGNIIGANKFINYYENKYTTIVEELEEENSSLWFMMDEVKASEKSIGQAIESMLRE